MRKIRMDDPNRDLAKHVQTVADGLAQLRADARDELVAKVGERADDVALARAYLKAIAGVA
jgi:hypothetical protein